MGVRRALGLSVLALLTGTTSVSRAAGLEELTRRLGALGAKTRTLTASFTQRKRLRLFRQDVVSRGRLAYARPDKLRWETLPPEESALVIAGSRAELRLPGEAARVLDLKQGDALAGLVGQLFVWLGARPAAGLTRSYEVAATLGEAAWEVRLKPRAEALRKRVSLITVTLGRDDLVLRSVQTQQPDGDGTLIEFSEVRRNVALPRETFR